MSEKTVGAAEFKANCLNLIEKMANDGEPIVVTKRGTPIALVSPIRGAAEPASIIGAMRGSVSAYENPFSAATDATDWDAGR
ncbi:MAG TPA: type II toxin-antitoxin system prevent-host-death family antitoxin [Pararhizobium sp.]|uniref:type II toxin-antitoxin system Phd/YefM family antitoxin n=1 Tax=Pararhizobium sp. TaxID=1977563 RepID=UPI002CC54CE0|nr:type II toxin-antitoxin system prevent-host-death family antitoxin [Pararhizobium sp.]HTO33860.1 type II toxin-antitoxin system prevent-host-death family antitoxin [Pararhizobium sp.]